MYQKVGMFGMAANSLIKASPNTQGPNEFGPQGPQVRGFGFIHDGSVDRLFHFHRANVFNLTETEALQMEQFMMAFDTDLAPVVGQQVTLASSNGGTVGSRIDLLIARAALNECEIVVKGNLGGVQRGWLRLANGTYRSDRAPTWSSPTRSSAPRPRRPARNGPTPASRSARGPESASTATSTAASTSTTAPDRSHELRRRDDHHHDVSRIVDYDISCLVDHDVQPSDHDEHVDHHGRSLDHDHNARCLDDDHGRSLDDDYKHGDELHDNDHPPVPRSRKVLTS